MGNPHCYILRCDVDQIVIGIETEGWQHYHGALSDKSRSYGRYDIVTVSEIISTYKDRDGVGIWLSPCA